MMLFILSAVYAQDTCRSGRPVGNNADTLVNLQAKTDCVIQQGPLYNFPDEKFSGILYKPALGWNIGDCKLSGEQRIAIETLRLLMIASDANFSFDDDSRILLRFSDGYVCTLHRTPNSDPIHLYQNNKYGTFYKTLVDFDVDDETKKRLMNPDMGIVKIRIVLPNGSKREYEISKGYQNKFIKHLIESYKKAKEMIEVRHQNNDDLTF